MRRIISLLMVLALFLGISTPAFAADNSLAAIYTEETAFDGILKNSSGDYAVYVPASADGTPAQYLPVGRLDISLDVQAQSDNMYEYTKLEPDTRAYIEKTQAEALRDGNTDMKITVFSPDLLPTTRGNRSEFYHTTPSGREMKGEYVFAYNLERIIIKKQGSLASKLAEDAISVAIYVTGQLKPIIAYLADGLSLLEYFSGTTGYIAVGGTQDYWLIKLKYDSFTQFTYDHNGTPGWDLMLTTQKILLEHIYHEQYYKVNESFHDSSKGTVYLNREIMTPNFLDPWDKAIHSAPYGDSEVITLNLNGTTFYF